jgi:hypothetical protein
LCHQPERRCARQLGKLFDSGYAGSCYCTCSASCMTACSSHMDSLGPCGCASISYTAPRGAVSTPRPGCKVSQWAETTSWSIYVNICKGQHASVVPPTLMAQVGGLCWASKCTCKLHATAAVPTQELTTWTQPTDQPSPQPVVQCPTATLPTCQRRAHPCFYYRRARQTFAKGPAAD